MKPKTGLWSISQEAVTRRFPQVFGTIGVDATYADLVTVGNTSLPILKARALASVWPARISRFFSCIATSFALIAGVI